MAEAASQLDLSNLKSGKLTELKTNRMQLSIYQRPIDLVVIILIILGIFGNLVKLTNMNSVPNNLYFLISIMLIIVYIRKMQIREKYIVTETGLILPYTWITTKLIPWDHITTVVEDELVEKNSGNKFKGLQLELDTTLIRLNTTGMNPPRMIFSSRDYNEEDLTNFTNQINRNKSESAQPPNTLAQRLSDQVNRSWENRYRLLTLNVVDSVSELLLHLLIAEVITVGIMDYSLWPWIGGILLISYFLIILIYQFLEIPSAIIGIRPHELGPILYDDADIITTIRFIIACKPFTVVLKYCEVIIPDDTLSQINQLKEIHPLEISPGKLTHGVVQIYGNHSKSIGAKIQFSYAEQYDEEMLYEIPIYW
ncbi:MAG: hypothetical protein ACXAD7_06475 [Candidatus Kariarchaeaceae archaeon]|jgi:hypothetical protein